MENIMKRKPKRPSFKGLSQPSREARGYESESLEQRKRMSIKIGIEQMLQGNVYTTEETRAMLGNRISAWVAKRDRSTREGAREVPEGRKARSRLARQPKVPSNETHPEARARLVAALLSAGWSVRTSEGHYLRARYPVLVHSDKPYCLTFLGEGVQQSGNLSARDCRGWSLTRLLAHCDRRSTPEAMKRLGVREALAEVRAGVPGIPHEEVEAETRLRIKVMFGADWKPRQVPSFASRAQERAFWTLERILLHFDTSNFEAALERAKAKLHRSSGLAVRKEKAAAEGAEQTRRGQVVLDEKADAASTRITDEL